MGALSSVARINIHIVDHDIALNQPTPTDILYLHMIKCMHTRGWHAALIHTPVEITDSTIIYLCILY